MFERELTIRLGSLEVRMMHLGNGHTRGDSVVWIPSQGICFAGDLVEFNAGVYTGDAWPTGPPRWIASRRCAPRRWCRAEAGADHAAGLPKPSATRRWVQTLYGCAREGVASGKSLKQVYADTRRVMDPEFGHVVIYEHAIPFDVSRAYDEASGIVDRASGPPSATATCGPS